MALFNTKAASANDTDTPETWDISDVITPVRHALLKCSLLMLRFTGWSFLIVIGLQLILGLLPAGFIFIQGHGPDLASQHGLTFLLVLLGLMFVADGVINSFRWPFEMNQMDSTRAKIAQAFQDKVAGWPDLTIHEWPKLVAKKTEAKQSLDRASQLIGSLRNLIASTAATIPLIILAASVNPWFPIILLVGTIPTVMIQIRFDRVVWDLEETFAGVRQRIDSVAKVATEADFAKDIRTYRMQRWVPGQWYADQFRIIRAVARLRYRSGYFLAIASLLQAATAVLICFLFIDQDNPATIVLVIGVLMTFVQNFYGLMDGFNQLMAFRGPSKSLMAFLSAKPRARRETLMVKDAGNAVEMDRLAYAYPEAGFTLRQLSTSIPAGKVTCIVGPNGAGKSTLIKVLTGLYDPTNGELREAHDAAEVSVMNQDFARFPLSIRENLACGRAEIMGDDGALTQALRQVGLEEILQSKSTNVFEARKSFKGLRDFLSRNTSAGTPTRGTLNGLDSYLYIDGDGNGTQLSGGQWQRLGIARTLLHAKHTKFALFDEPTSALDPFAEVDLLDFIVETLTGETLVLVTHRLSQVAKADHVLVIENGAVSASGSPAEVYRSSSWYRDAFDLQASGYLQAAAHDSRQDGEN